MHHYNLHSLWLLHIVTPHQVLHLQAFPLILGRLVLGLQETRFDICENNNFIIILTNRETNTETDRKKHRQMNRQTDKDKTTAHNLDLINF